MAKLRAANPAAGHGVYLADLSRLSEQKRVGHEIAAEPRIDILINNAGAFFNRRMQTEDGLEMTFALNHMSYFVLTNILLPKLPPGARIVCTASDAHKGARLALDDLQARKRFSGWRAYANSKLCNILFTRELARRIAGTGVTANCLHPGFVRTRFGDASGGLLGKLVVLAKNLMAISVEDGAKTIIYLASSPNVGLVSGEYFYESKATTATKEAQNDADAKLLWEISQQISGVG
jgi:NAD(P)-dependent dehydrogenase (short-subunit alcohol dehydrogenase family)